MIFIWKIFASLGNIKPSSSFFTRSNCIYKVLYKNLFKFPLCKTFSDIRRNWSWWSSYLIRQRILLFFWESFGNIEYIHRQLKRQIIDSQVKVWFYGLFIVQFAAECVSLEVRCQKSEFRKSFFCSLSSVLCHPFLLSVICLLSSVFYRPTTYELLAWWNIILLKALKKYIISVLQGFFRYLSR